MRKRSLLPALFGLLLSLPVFAQQKGNIELLPAKTFAKSLDTAAEKQIIDVRTPEEFQSGHIANAKNINIYDKDFKERIQKLSREQPVYVYCKGGVRSAEAAKTLHGLGFTTIYDLQGGIMSWENNQLPVTTGKDIIASDNTFTSSDFDRLLAENKVLLVDFYAPWCIPCRQMVPSLKKLEKEYKGKVVFSRIDLDKAKSLAQQLGIESIPVIAVYKNGKELKRVTGYQSASQLKGLVQYLLKNRVKSGK